MVNNLLLVILDGFGIGENVSSNAIYKANIPNLKNIFKNYPTTQLEASGMSVGLPEGQMGNSEVGHTNIGAGRIVYQDLTYINKSIEDGSFFENNEFKKIMKYVSKNQSSLHLMGLLSDGGVHSHISHLYALLKFAKMSGVKRVCIHAWTDGRDTLPKSGLKYIKDLEEFIYENKIGKIETLSGRFYAMDRDKRWERTELAYDAIVNSHGEKFDSPEKAILDSYQKGITDEFIKPSVRKGYKGIAPNDAVICFNFRPDRARQITHMFMNEKLIFPHVTRVNVGKYCGLSQYDENIPEVMTAFKPREIKNSLGEYISNLGLTQLRIAETEKYAHVTFFFNAGIESPYKNEDRIIISSPKVNTYDLKPEMSAYEVTKVAEENIRTKKYNFIVINYANPDMVGHTGNFDATVKSLEAVDACISRLISEMNKIGGVTIITADHGNAEKMHDKQGQPFTAHTLNKVPFSVVGFPCSLKNKGALCDIAPTILEILNIKKPCEMTGHSLIN